MTGGSPMTQEWDQSGYGIKDDDWGFLDIIDICGWDQSGYIVISNTYVSIIEGSLEVKLPTIWTDGKAEVGRVREEKRSSEKMREEKESEERRCRFTVFFQ